MIAEPITLEERKCVTSFFNVIEKHSTQQELGGTKFVAIEEGLRWRNPG
jgi:hypothetical protein